MANEYNIPLYFAFVDYEKAFDSIEFEQLFEGLKKPRVAMRRTWTYCVTTIARLHQFYDSIRTVKKIKFGTGAKQGEHLSQTTSCVLYSIIYKINWENKGVRIDGNYWFHVIFADYIVLIANSTSKLLEMLQDSMTSAIQ